MNCAECEAFLIEYKATAERYALLTGHLSRTAHSAAFQGLAFRRLKDAVALARIECHRLREAMTLHKESSSCRRPRSSSGRIDFQLTR
jgi:hypothetical protein